MSTLQHFALAAAAALSALSPLASQAAGNPAATVDLVYSHGSLSGGLQSIDGLDLHGSLQLGGGDVAYGSVVQERKFGASGGVVGLGYTKVLSPAWLVTGNFTAGHGGPNWANRRVDLEVGRKWGSKLDLVTSAALYHAAFDGNRSDRGVRLGVVSYQPGGLVLEGGLTLNTSDPGAVRSRMPFVAATLGQEGRQYVSLRLSSGTEAYQAIGAAQQLVNFHSSSVGGSWRRWLAPQWGVTASAEWYRNPSYRKLTAGGGVFAQW